MMKILMLIFAFGIFSVFPTTEIIAGCGSIAPYPHVPKKMEYMKVVQMIYGSLLKIGIIIDGKS